MNSPALEKMLVADLLDAWPQALEVLVRHGFSPLTNPITRRTLARTITLEGACRLRGVSLEAVLADLRALSDNCSS